MISTWFIWFICFSISYTEDESLTFSIKIVTLPTLNFQQSKTELKIMVKLGEISWNLLK
jgi:hypothetical protein